MAVTFVRFFPCEPQLPHNTVLPPYPVSIPAHQIPSASVPKTPPPTSGGRKKKKKKVKMKRKKEEPPLEGAGARREGVRGGSEMGKRRRRYWLLKTEPTEWSWEDQVSSTGGVAPWDGVRNRQAVKHMMTMRAGDRCFFYHSGRRPSIVSVVEVVRPWYEDGAEGGAVDVRAVGEMRRPVELRDVREKAAAEAREIMKGFALLRQPRLSVVPVPEDVWEVLCEMGGGFEEEAPAPTATAAAEESSDEEDEAASGKDGE